MGFEWHVLLPQKVAEASDSVLRVFDKLVLCLIAYVLAVALIVRSGPGSKERRCSLSLRRGMTPHMQSAALHLHLRYSPRNLPGGHDVKTSTSHVPSDTSRRTLVRTAMDA